MPRHVGEPQPEPFPDMPLLTAAIDAYEAQGQVDRSDPEQVRRARSAASAALRMAMPTLRLTGSQVYAYLTGEGEAAFLNHLGPASSRPYVPPGFFAVGRRIELGLSDGWPNPLLSMELMRTSSTDGFLKWIRPGAVAHIVLPYEALYDRTRFNIFAMREAKKIPLEKRLYADFLDPNDPDRYEPEDNV